MAGADYKKQFHLVCDVSLKSISGILFQLVDQPPGTEATDKVKKDIRIIMFMSFKLSDVETRYTTTEREALTVVRYIAEVCWLIIRNPFPLKVYTDH